MSVVIPNEILTTTRMNEEEMKREIAIELQKLQTFMVLWDNISPTKLPYRKTNQTGYYI